MELKLLIQQGFAAQGALLIVPYGIETLKFVPWHSFQELLIVPYGIETLHQPQVPLLALPFNRTLWN